MTSSLAFHHLGLVVKEPGEAILFLTTLGYEMGAPVFDENQKVHLMLATHATQPAVEIIHPGAVPGPIDHLIQRHASGLVYHVCLATGNLAQTLEDWEALGLRAVCVSPPQPAVLFGGRKVSFYNMVGVGLIELLE